MKVSDNNLVKDLETFEIKLNDPDFNMIYKLFFL